jgi:hypothetical protein
MVPHGLAAVVGRLLFMFATRLIPLVPVPLVLILERWVLSTYWFSSSEIVIFRIAYLLFVLVGVYLTYVLAMICW